MKPRTQGLSIPDHGKMLAGDVTDIPGVGIVHRFACQYCGRVINWVQDPDTGRFEVPAIVVVPGEGLARHHGGTLNVSLSAYNKE